MPALQEAELPPVAAAQIHTTLAKATATLLAERNAQGYWAGELSSSALSTATAVTALAVAARAGVSDARDAERMRSGLAWLAEHQNTDGGWGDTTRSLGNISTTTLCWAAFGAVPGADAEFAATTQAAQRWLNVQAASHESLDALSQRIIARYGRDRTFSVPILTMCALSGRMGAGRAAWERVIALPFELAAVPHQLFAALKLPVVSYALPALIAIGLAHHVHAPSRNPLARGLRAMTRARTLRVLTQIQPENGGFLEATPLTSFVCMSLAASGLHEHVVTRRGLDFLRASQRADGSWPIDTNLATWCTTLAVDALPEQALVNTGTRATLAWLLGQQYRVEHPYTHAAPGGWAWTDLPGGVPDADDTSGALVALAKLAHGGNGEGREAALHGVCWLLDLQNRDGGIPTFCRGWGALPFDRSSADITAHAVRAWRCFDGAFDDVMNARMRRAAARAIAFLARAQADDGSWSPLWFGNEFAPTEENFTYGTANVVAALASVNSDTARAALGRGIDWLLAAQKHDGSWSGFAGGSPSTEETALATKALALCAGAEPRVREAMLRGAAWLAARVESGAWREPAPIGFYFAKLWYHERLYPMIFTVAALERVARVLRP